MIVSGVVDPLPAGAIPVVLLASSSGTPWITSFDEVGNLPGVHSDGRSYSEVFGIGVVAVSPDKFSTFLAKVNEATELHGIRAYDGTTIVRFLDVFASGIGRRANNWAIEQIGVRNFWKDQKSKGASAIVGHIDGGVARPHRALRESVSAITSYQAGRPQPEPTGAVGHWHGTVTAGVIAARNARSQAGNLMEVGVAPEAKILCHAVEFDEKDDVLVCEIAQSLIALERTRPIAVCLAIRRTSHDDVLLGCVRRIAGAGVLPIVAAGNEKYGVQTSGMNEAAECLSVGAVAGSAGSWGVWEHSASISYPGGRTIPDLVAPGVGVTSTTNEGGIYDYKAYHGTSIGAAQVAGLAALLKSVCPNANGPDIREALIRSCTSTEWPRGLPADGGKGVPNAVRAYNCLISIMEESGRSCH